MPRSCTHRSHQTHPERNGSARAESQVRSTSSRTRSDIGNTRPTLPLHRLRGRAYGKNSPSFANQASAGDRRTSSYSEAPSRRVSHQKCNQFALLRQDQCPGGICAPYWINNFRIATMSGGSGCTANIAALPGPNAELTSAPWVSNK